MKWTVVSKSGDNLNLAYNGTSGNGAYTGATAATKSLLDSKAISKDALAAGCITNNGSSSNSKTNAPSSEYWLTSGKVYVPLNVYSYSVSNESWYQNWIQSRREDLAVSIPAQYTSTLSYSAGATASVAASSTQITYTNALLYYDTTYASKGYQYLYPDTGRGSPSTTKTSFAFYGAGTLNGEPKSFSGLLAGGGSGWIAFDPCGTGGDVQFKAKSATQYYESDNMSIGWTAYNYSEGNNRRWSFAGYDGGAFLSDPSSPDGILASYNLRNDCETVYQYSTSDRTETIYYRPYITLNR